MAKSAFDRVMGYLGMRDHTLRELYQKLSRYHDTEEIEKALKKAHDLNLLPDPQTMASRVSQALLNKGKGRRYISQYLKKKGLPLAPVSEEQELEKGQKLVQNQLGFEPPYTIQQKQKIFRYLNNRGFDSRIVRQVMNEK